MIELVRMFQLEQRLGLAVACLLLQIGARFLTAMMPNDRTRRKRDPVAGLLATSTGRPLDRVCAGCGRLASSPSETARLFATAGRLRRGRGVAPVETSGQVQSSRRQQVAWRPLRQFASRIEFIQ